uniref:Uncharacterized protein n=1 Tax=viral metagenome TaxID=1070528 RepID=A0A6H2A6U9_9ZZZZ
MKIDAGFIVSKSALGPYWQIRLRDLRTGSEDTVDRVYTITEARKKWDNLSITMSPLRERP